MDKEEHRFSDRGLDGVKVKVEAAAADDEGSGGGFRQTPAEPGPADGDLQRGDGDEDPGGPYGAAGENEKAKKKRRRRKPRVVPSIRVYCGTFIHSTSPDRIEILQNWMIGVDGGKIVFSEKRENYGQILDKYKLSEFEKECFISLEDGTFMMPGFVDVHTDVVPYLVSGLLLDAKDGNTTKVNGLLDRRRKKLNLISDDRIAAEIFQRFIQHSLHQGITCASYNGSTVESAARLLADTVGRCKQRAQIGLEIFFGDNRDDTHMLQMIKAKDVIQHILRKQNDLLQPSLIFSKPLPGWMEAKMVELAKELDLPLKTIVGDFLEGELDGNLRSWINLGQDRLLRYHKKCGLLDNRAILINASHCNDQDLKLIAESGASVAYCPSTSMLNCMFSSLSRFTSRNITVGLGTDINTSHCVSMLDTIRRCIQCTVLSYKCPRPFITGSNAKCQKFKGDEVKVCNEVIKSLASVEFNDVNQEETERTDEDNNLEAEEIVDISLMRLFHMATLGGATALGLSNKIGNFEVGKEFDAILINPYVPLSRFIVLHSHDSILEILEKFLTLGDDRNVVGMFVKGERLF